MKKKLKSLLIGIGLSTAIVTPLILTSCNSEIQNGQNGEGSQQKPDDGNNGGGQKPGGDSGNEQNKKYSISIEDDHKNDVKLSTTEAMENQEVTVTLADSLNPILTTFYYTINNVRSKQPITTTGKVGKFNMPKGNVSIDVETKFSLSVKSVNNLNKPINGGTIKINNKDSTNGEFLNGEKVSLLFILNNDYEIEKIEVKNNLISIDKNTKEIIMPKDNVEITLVFKAKTTSIVKDIVTSTLKSFDVWDFLPEKFNSKNKLFQNATQKEFVKGFVNKNEIQSNGVGIQFNQAFSIMNAINIVIKGADLIFNSANEIANLYQKYIDNSPINKEYENNTGSVKFKISMNETELRILAKIATCSMEISTNLKTNDHYGRIQLSDSNAIKFEIKNNLVKIGLKTLGVARMMIEIDKTNNDSTIVKLYNYVGKVNSNEDHDSKLGIRTTSIIYIDDKYLSIMGKKGDFIRPSKENRNLEVYDINTGEFLTSKVYEYVNSKFKYLTNWYPLKFINGIDNIKQDVFEQNSTKNITTIAKDEEQEDLPKNSYYLNNNSTEKFKFKRTGIGGIYGTRIYDIEMKDSIIYGLDKEEIKDTKVQVPMLFIQDKYDNDKNTDIFKTINDQNKKISLNLSSNFSKDLKTKINEYYTLIKEKYDSFEEWMSTSKVTEYVGDQDPWLSKKN